MTVEELKDVIVYLQGRIEELESKKMCECAEEPPEAPTKPTVTYKATPKEVAPGSLVTCNFAPLGIKPLLGSHVDKNSI